MTLLSKREIFFDQGKYKKEGDNYWSGEQRKRNHNIYLVRGRYKKKFRGSYKDHIKEFYNLFRRWKLLIEGDILIQEIIFFLVFCWSYYFNLVNLVDQFGLPSMPKREIVENRLRESVEEEDYWEYIDTSMMNILQSLFFQWCQTCYLLVR